MASGYADGPTSMPTVPPPQTSPSAPPVGEPPLGPDKYSEDTPHWPLWYAPGAVALGFGLGIIATIFVQVAARAGGRSASNPTAAESLVGDLLFDLAFVAAALYFASLRGRPRPEVFGFRRAHIFDAVAGVVAAGIAYYLITDIYASLLSLHGKDKLPAPLGTTQSTVALVGVAVFVCVVAPIAEEFFFRGFIFGVLRRMRVVVGGRNIGTWLAALITGILFGLAHSGSALSQDLIPLGFLGFVLCLLRWRTRSLYPCMALHSINNALALGITQFHWNGLEILGLMVGSLAVVGGLTLPLAPRSQPA